MTDHDTIAALTAEMRADSEAWFPWLHDKQTATVPLTVAYTLGLAGEAGEVANLVKKANRDGWDTVGDALAAELADVFVYLLVLAGEQGIDIVQAYRDKRRENVLRFAGEELLAGVPGGGEPQPTTSTDNGLRRHDPNDDDPVTRAGKAAAALRYAVDLPPDMRDLAYEQVKAGLLSVGGGEPQPTTSPPRCPASVSGDCLGETYGFGRCPDGECNDAPTSPTDTGDPT